jgi:hypothetical protein
MSQPTPTDPDELLTLATKAVGGLQMVAQAQVKRAEVNEQNRLNLLHLHGAAGMYVGPLFAAIGATGMQGTTWVALRLVPWMPYSMGVLFFLSGLLLYEATTRRMVRTEIAGLIAMATCYTIISTSFALAVVIWMCEWPSLNEAFVTSLLGAEAVAVLAWSLRRRRVRHSLALHLCAGWSVGFSIGLMVADGSPEPRPSFYAHGVYAHLSAILIVHLVTLALRVKKGS